jgi:hypothetical protein
MTAAAVAPSPNGARTQSVASFLAKHGHFLSFTPLWHPLIATAREVRSRENGTAPSAPTANDRDRVRQIIRQAMREDIEAQRSVHLTLDLYRLSVGGARATMNLKAAMAQLIEELPRYLASRIDCAPS